MQKHSSVASSATPDAGLSRRRFLQASGVATSVVATAGVTAAMGATPAGAAPASAFLHGVASGDPTPDAVLLWTRVTPTPQAAPGSGLGPDVAVSWVVAHDAHLTSVVRSGSVTASATSDHTVKVDVDGLEPSTTYHYGFALADGRRSPTGTTATAPAADADVARLRFGVVSCANWESGYFGAYRGLAARHDLDAIIHLGDYIYEYRTGDYAGKNGVVRPYEPRNEIVTLRDYRTRHAQYKTDPDLQAAHLTVPWICTWDDHESANDSWSGGAENHQPATEGRWSDRKAASVQAYYEWMPVRAAGSPDNRHVYRRLRFGKLLELSMLDLRTYRSQQAKATDGRAIDDPRRTITGADQMAWLTGGLTTSTARWKVVGNPVMISPTLIPPLEPSQSAAITDMLGLPRGGITYNADQWDGYPADRARLLDALRTHRVDNTVFITGDIHSSWACDVPVDPANYPGAGNVATELVVTSVSAANIDDLTHTPEHTAGAALGAALRAANHHVKFVDLDTHGYGVFEVTPAGVQMDHWYVVAKEDPRSDVYFGSAWRVDDGSQRVHPARQLV